MDKISIKQAILDLLYVDVHLSKVAQDFPNLKPITDYLLESNFIDDEDKPWPSLKSISEATGIEYSTTRTSVRKIHELMFPFMDTPYLNFSNTKFELEIHKFGVSHYMVLDSLPVIPKVGENIQLPFLKAKFQTDDFYVQRVNHYFFRDTQYIQLTILGGDYNLYRNFRKDEGLL